jgi:hypothetical protein
MTQEKEMIEPCGKESGVVQSGTYDGYAFSIWNDADNRCLILFIQFKGSAGSWGPYPPYRSIYDATDGLLCHADPNDSDAIRERGLIAEYDYVWKEFGFMEGEAVDAVMLSLKALVSHMMSIGC